MSNLLSWIKDNRRWILLAFTLFLIITLSFGIGYLVAKEIDIPPIIIEKHNN